MKKYNTFVTLQKLTLLQHLWDFGSPNSDSREYTDVNVFTANLGNKIFFLYTIWSNSETKSCNLYVTDHWFSNQNQILCAY